MSRKKKKAKRNRPPPSPPAFAPGSAVRVKKGLPDPEYPDISLGGWSGVVVSVHPRARRWLYLIEWDQRTLSEMPPIYRHRTERDGTEYGSIWLAEDDLEAATGETVPIEQPSELVPRPLREDDPGDRIRAIFRCTSDEPLPPVDTDSLRRYREHLIGRLSFPFAALYIESTGFFLEKAYPILVLRLLPAEEADADGLLVEAAYNEEKHILPLGAIEMARKDPSERLIRDYITWLEMAPAEDEQNLHARPLKSSSQEPGNVVRWPLTFLHYEMYCAGAGTCLGAILAAFGEAQTGLTIGAAVVGALGFPVGIWYGKIAAPHRGLALRLVFFGGFGMVAGALIGAMAGGVAVAYVGAIPGSILGTVVSRWLAKGDRGAKFTWGIAGAFIGGLALALYHDWDAALAGASLGILLGLVGGVVILLLLVIALGMLYISGSSNKDFHV